MLGRRGPAQAAFTSAELRELGAPRRAWTCGSTPTRSSSTRSRALARRAGHASPHARTSSCCASSPRGRARADARRRIVLRFLRSPVEIRGRAGSRPSTSAATRSCRADDGSLRARRRATSGRDDRVRARPALGRLPGGPAARRAVRRAQLHPSQRARPGAHARRRAAARRLRGRLDQARPDRHPRHQQARRGGDRRPPGRGPRRGRAAGAASTRPRGRSTRCSPSASRTWSRPRAGARSTATSCAGAARRSARA